jgi:hypothetical protein
MSVGTRVAGKIWRTSISRFIFMIAAAAPGLADALKYEAKPSAARGSLATLGAHIVTLIPCRVPQWCSILSSTSFHFSSVQPNG